MRAHAQQQSQPQKGVSSRLTRSSTAIPELNPYPHSILHLHRTNSNQVVQEKLHNAQQLESGWTATAPSLLGHDFGRIPIHSPAPQGIPKSPSIDEPGEAFEKKADRTFQPVMRIPEPRLQRACACGGHTLEDDECSECRNKNRPDLQTKLTISQPGDIYEQEADRIADQVLATPAHHAGSVAPPRIQRLAGKPNAQADAAPASVDQTLATPGMPLEPALRQDMEQRFGHNFSQVRVHTDARAAESARAVNALAYTVGRDIVFAAGRYAPATLDGSRLLAHELTHVVQQAAPDAYPQDRAAAQDTRIAPALGSSLTAVDQVPSAHGLNGVVLQRRLVNENAAGCGVCNPASVVGTYVHGLVQEVSFAAVANEEPIGFVGDEENGRLDLLDVVVDTRARKLEANIGEIKPNNLKGIKAGVKDLAYYDAAVYDYFKRGYPDYSVIVGRLDVAPIPAVLPYQDLATCPSQLVEIEDSGDGLYLYNCDPPRSAIDDECCEGQDDEEETESPSVQLPQRLILNAARRQFERRATEKAIEKAAEKTVTVGARLVASGGAGAIAAGALPVVAMAGVFVALGSGYAEARAAVRNENTASGFSQGFVMGLLGWEWHQAVARFGRTSLIRMNRFDEATDVIRVNAYNRGLRAGFDTGSRLSVDMKKAYLREIRKFTGPRDSKSWSRQDQISYVIELASAARANYLKPE